MSIRHQVGGYIQVNQEVFQYFGVSFRRLWNPGGRAIQPFFDLFPGLTYGFRPFEYPWICHYPQKSDQARPRQANRCGCIQAIVQPPFCSVMLWKVNHVGVYKEVCINQNHLNLLPSATARTSEMSSRLDNWQRPRFTERVSYVFFCRGGLVISLRPCRRAWLTITFRLVLRALRTRSKILATSSSMVSVVLIHQYIIHLMR